LPAIRPGSPSAAHAAVAVMITVVTKLARICATSRVRVSIYHNRVDTLL
jgi:hypothetical protein